MRTFNLTLNLCDAAEKFTRSYFSIRSFICSNGDGGGAKVRRGRDRRPSFGRGWNAECAGGTPSQLITVILMVIYNQPFTRYMTAKLEI